MKSDAKLFFASTTDTVFNYISNMQQTSNKLGVAAATPTGWNILRIVAAQRLTSSATGPSTAGATFVGDVFACMDPTVISLPLDTAFTNHLAAALSGGIFEVRGDAANTLDAWAWMLVNGTRTPAPPIWGVEPDPTWPSGPYLVYAYPKDVGGTLPASQLIDGTSTGFELGTVPTIGSKSGLRVGVCVNTKSNDTTANLLQHNGALLPNSSPTTLCSTTPTFVAQASSSMSITQRLAALFMPTPAFADAFFTGGTPDGWSPFGPKALTGSQIALTFTQQPVNTSISVPITVTIHAAISGVAVPDVSVTLSVDNNSGVPAGAVIVGGNPTASTDASGNVSFTIQIGKAGGYLLAANGSLSGVATQTGVSNLFNVKNQ